MIYAKEKPKNLFLIICSDNQPIYPFIMKIWRSYMNLDEDHFKCYFLRASNELSSDALIDEDTLWIKGE